MYSVNKHLKLPTPLAVAHLAQVLLQLGHLVPVLLQIQVLLAHSVNLPHNQVSPQFSVVNLHLPVAQVSVHLANQQLLLLLLLHLLMLLVDSVKVLLGLSGNQQHKHRLNHLLLVLLDSSLNNSHSNPVSVPSVSQQLQLHLPFPLVLAPLAHSGLTLVVPLDSPVNQVILEHLDKPINQPLLELSVLNQLLQPLDKLHQLPVHLVLHPQILMLSALLLLLLHLQPPLDLAVNNPLPMSLLLLPLPLPVLLDPLALLSHRDSPLLPSVNLPLLELVSVRVH